MSEVFSVGQRVRVRIGLDDCPQYGKVHGWMLEGRTGTIIGLEKEREENHIYVVGYFLPPLLREQVPGLGQGPWRVPLLQRYAPTELERCRKLP